MKMSVADMVDRYTILKIKEEKCLKVEGELKQIEEALIGKVERTAGAELYAINSEMWNLENYITIEMEATETNATRIGMYAFALRILNRLRINAKNRIAIQHGEYKEVKNY